MTIQNNYMSMGAYEKAEPLMSEAIEIDEKALGRTHPQFATSLNNLAQLYSKGLTKTRPGHEEDLEEVERPPSRKPCHMHLELLEKELPENVRD